MKTQVTRATIDVIEVRNDLDDLIGRVYRIGTIDSTYHIGEAHDWYSDNPVNYDPIVFGLSKDPSEMLAEIERRARAAQAPEFTGFIPDTEAARESVPEAFVQT